MNYCRSNLPVLSFEINWEKIRIFRELDWLSEVSGLQIMAKNDISGKFQIIRFCQKHRLAITV